MICYLVCKGCGWQSEPKTSDILDQKFCTDCRDKLSVEYVPEFLFEVNLL
jgi:hypothetical protein